jgi:hypothetical protein
MNFTDDPYYFNQPNEEGDGEEAAGICFVKSITKNNGFTFGVHMFFIEGIIEGYKPISGEYTLYLTPEEMDSYFMPWEDGEEWVRIHVGSEELDVRRYLIETTLF